MTTQTATRPALKFITCGSVDDGKSTLIGRLLVDSKSVLQDHLAGVQRHGETDLALLTDGLSAEREQGITIDVAYRYFSTESRKFIIGDSPGHEQYTRNMVTAASSADAAVVLVDATKLDWSATGFSLLPQTRRHSLLLKLLRVPSIVFAINKLDAVTDAATAFVNIAGALQAFADHAALDITAIVPVSALKGWNVVNPEPNWCNYSGPSLLQLLESLPVTAYEEDAGLAFAVQWVEKFHDSADTSKGRRVYWGRVGAGIARPGDSIRVFPSGQTALIKEVLNSVRQPTDIAAGHSAGLVLDREVDISRGDWVLAQHHDAPSQNPLNVTLAWLDDEPLVAGRVYWALHGHRWVKAKVLRIVHRLDVNSLQELEATELPPNAIGHVQLSLQQPLVTLPFEISRSLGSLVLVDTATHKTSAAVMVRE
ncbi:MAG: sulfate adenylyltransferase subunit 1 [Burkholderiales bacterium]|jgi:sulfate adenylyltransferase subunit 1